jgi:ABC transport system ATP-binding/permease protein
VVAAKAASPSQRPSGNKQKALTSTEQRELAGLPDRIDQAEQLVSSLMGKLGDPSTYAGGGGDVVTVQRELDRARAEADRLTQRWEELEVKRSSAT